MTDHSRGSDDARDRLVVRRVRRAMYVALAVLGLLTLASVLRAPDDPLVLSEAAVVIVLALAIIIQHDLGRRLTARRLAREVGLTRMLQGMSRSASPDAIVDAIVDELRGTADADHIVVARLRPVDRVVEATLVSNRARVPPSRTVLPSAVLDPARLPASQAGATGSPEQRVADEIARSLRESYALPNSLAAPLVANGRILGALVLSRRVQRDWGSDDRRLLVWAAAELSAALARAFAFEEAENQANVDVLTGLPNRRYLEEMLATIGPRRRSVDRLGALMIDLDHFKQLNDRYGHPTGDRVLRAVAERISAAVRADDTPARYGGEEFAVVLRRASSENAAEVAERIRALVESIPPAEMGVREKVTVSIGVAVGDVQAGAARALLDAADGALYEAKRMGRNRVAVAG